jgi:Response regulator receiver domain
MLRLQPDGHPWLFDLKLDGFRRIADTIAGWMLSKDENHLKLRPDHVEIGPHARLAGIHFWQLRTRGGWTSLFLCCEDDSATAQSIEVMLRSEGFNVYTTDLGGEGVDLGRLYDYVIIVLDLSLPDMSGYDVLRTLRVNKVRTPILVLSGLSAAADKIKG